MVRIHIDNHAVEVQEGATVLHAAEQCGIIIPTLCYLKGFTPNASCMACVVKLADSDRLVPACATVVEDNMRVESETAVVHEARKTALELLLSDHVGDCVAPCQRICPAGMNIPEMMRFVREGKWQEALITIKKDLALPAVLGYLCNHPCENGCRRKNIDAPASTRLIERYVAEKDLCSGQPYLPRRKPSQNKSVAILGTGPTALSAAYYLLQEGIDCTMFDVQDKSGGFLRSYSLEQLPENILDAEIGLIEKLGACFQLQTRINDSEAIIELQKKYQALLIEFDTVEIQVLEQVGLKTNDNGLIFDSKTFETSIPTIFVGRATRRDNPIVHAVADGKAVGQSIIQFLNHQPITPSTKPFSTHIGRMQPEELQQFLDESNRSPRLPLPDQAQQLTDEQIRNEARQCLHCDCRQADHCKLRLYAEMYGAKANRFKTKRQPFELQQQHGDVVFEPGKCIDCGLCLQVTQQSQEDLGLTFIGRGFDVKVAVPFDQGLEHGLKKTAAECARVCPAGALALKNENFFENAKQQREQ